MSYEFFVSIRHLSAKKSQKFISLNTWISMAGVGLGVMALIVVIAVMSGFGKDLRDKILGTNSHVVVTNVNRTMVEDYQNILEQVRGVDGVTAAAPFIMNQVMLIHGDRVSGIVVRGIDPGAKGTVSDLAKNMIAGTVLDLKNEPRLIKDGKLYIQRGNLRHLRALFPDIDQRDENFLPQTKSLQDHRFCLNLMRQRKKEKN